MASRSMDDVGDDTPGPGIDVRAQWNGGVPGMFGSQNRTVIRLAKSLHGELTVDDGNDHHAGPRCDGSVDDQEVAIMDTGALHGSPAGSKKEGGRGASDQFFVEVEGAIDVVIGG